jgi:hypothetical protein
LHGPTGPLRAELDTRSIRQHDVEDHDVEAITSQAVTRIGTGFDRFDPVRGELQIAHEKPSGPFVIVHDQHPHGSAPAPARAEI